VEAVARPRAPGRHLDLSGVSMETASKPEIRPGKDEGPVEAVLEPREMWRRSKRRPYDQNLSRGHFETVSVPCPYLTK
jgi:hypothetical protein